MDDQKSRIVENASRMFLRYGIKSITMDEIAESQGISKRTLYEFFKNKEELLKECIDYNYQISIMQRDALKQQFPDDPLEIIYQTFRNIMINLNHIHPGFITDIQKYHSRLWKEHIESNQQENINFTKSVIDKGVKKGIFHKQINQDLLSVWIHKLMQQLHQTEMLPETQFQRTEVFQQLILNFIRGMATVDGLKKIDQKFEWDTQ